MNLFVFKMAWREGRGAWRRFLFFLFCVALGVGSIVGVGNLAANLEEMTFHEARNILAADLEARLNRPLSPQGEEVLSDLASRGVRVVRVTELLGMATTEKGDASQLVEVKAVGPGYPFYGLLKVDPPAPDLLRDPNAVWVQEALLIRLRLRVGDRLKLGEGRFTIRGIIRREPDRVVGTFSLGPRLLLSQEGLARTELVQPGSRLTRRILFKTPPSSSICGGQSGKTKSGSSYAPTPRARIGKADCSLTPETLKEELTRRWSNESVQLHTYREAQPRLGRFLENFSLYLGLVGLITLMIGGIGVASNIHSFLAERIQTIAILKCLGAPSSLITRLYLFLSLVLGAIGGGIGILLGAAVQRALRSLFAPFLPPDFTFRWFALPVVRGMTMGILTTLLFSLWPLRIVRRTPPFLVFREEIERPSRRIVDRPLLLLSVGMVLGWVGLSIWQAGSWRLGATVAAAIGGAVVLLIGVAAGTLRGLRTLPPPRSLILRYGLHAVGRPGRGTLTIALSVGIGAFILLTLAQVERNLMAQIRENIPQEAPSLFLIDIQPDQKGPFEKMMAAWKFKRPPELTPLVRSRLYAIDGKKVSEMKTEERPDGWYFTREYVLTYQKNPPPHNTLRRGRWWGGPVGKEPLISVEAEAARHLGIDLGSTVTFDIQGVLISAKVASLREVDWGSLTTNFFFIFSPGALEGAPVTYVATVASPPQDDLPLQSAVIKSFPNVTVIHLREVLETIARILSEMARTIRFMAFLGWLVGLIVLAGAIAATRAKRRYEAVLFKTLGATRPVLIGMMAVEYGLLGAVSASAGALLSVGLSWGIARFLFDIPWRLDGAILLVGLIGTVLLTVGVGFLMTYRIVREKPLAILRTE